MHACARPNVMVSNDIAWNTLMCANVFYVCCECAIIIQLCRRWAIRWSPGHRPSASVLGAWVPGPYASLMS